MKRIEEEIHQTRPFNSQYHKAAVNLIYTGKWIIKHHTEVFQEHNLSLQQYNLLRILRGASPTPVTLNYIRKRMLDKMSDASRIVENLFNKGLVDRKLNPKDRRKVNIQITKEGLHILSEIDKKSHILDSYLHNLDGKEIDQLNALLDKLRD